MPKNLYERSGTWYARVYTHGIERRVSLRTGDLKVARQRLRIIEKEAADARFGVVDEPGWLDAVVAYNDGVLDRPESLKPRTAERYRVSLRQIDPYFRELQLSDITVEQIARFVGARQREGATNATIRRDLTTISRVMAFATSQGMVPRNVVADYDRRLIRERTVEIDAPSDAIIEEAAALVPDAWGHLLRFLRATGMRLGEALRARWSDLDGDRLTIHKTKTGVTRTIEVAPAALPPRSGDRLFATLIEDSVMASRRYFNLLPSRPAVPRFRLHDLRHAYAIDEIRKGRDIYDLSHHLGHSSVKVTERYLGYAPGRRSTARRSS